VDRSSSHLETFARRSLNYLVRNFDPRTRTLYFWTFLLARPPEFRHDAWDYPEGTGRRVDALACCRIMTGDASGEEREAGFRELLYSFFDGPRGLAWRPETPWCKRGAEMMDQASAMFPLVTELMETGSKRAEERIEAMVHGLLDICRRDFRGLYFPGAIYWESGWRKPARVSQGPHDLRIDDTWLEGDPAYYGRILIPLTKYAELTGSKPALALAEGIAYNVAWQSKRYAPDGGFARSMHGETSVWTNGHWHSRFATAAGLVRFGRLAGRQEYIDFARKVFDWGLAHGTAFGWFPEFAGRKVSEEGCETCNITDAIDLATQFGDLGDAVCYEFAERFATNQLAEAQVRDVRFVDAIARMPDTERSSFDRVAERSIGGFAGWSAPNDLISGYPDPGWVAENGPDHRRTLMDCCCGYGNRGLYLAWLHAVTEKTGTAFVNMMLSRRTKELAVESFFPAEGLVRLTANAAKRVAIRIPSWGTPVVTGRGRPWPVSRQGHYLHLGEVPPGTTLDCRFDVKPRKESVTTGEKGLNEQRTYEVTWLGDRVVEVQPEGRFSPLYNHRLVDEAPELSCHLPKKEVPW
jgi:hypothetical protein